MSRSLRMQYPGAVYHVTSRGNKRENVYVTNEDRNVFLSLLKDIHEKYHWIFHAYCLMDNHYHLLIETPLGNLSIGMRHLNSIYTQRFNRLHKRVGHVFQGRYKSILVDKENYLLELSRYIVLNPVRAGIVGIAEDWEWSSYRATLGYIASPSWLNRESLLSLFGNTQEHATQKYQLFVSEGMQHGSIWSHVKQQIYLGSDEFINKIQQNMLRYDKDYSEIPSCQRSIPSRSIEEYIEQNPSRNLAIKKAYASGIFTMKELGAYFGLHYSRISKIVNTAT